MSKGIALALIWVLAACAAGMTKEEEKTFTSYVNLGISYVSQGNLPSAENALKRAAAIDRDDYRIVHAYALLAQFSGDLVLAEKLFQDMLEKNPEFSRGRNNYGVFLATIDRDLEAIQELRAAASDPLYDRRDIAYENLADVAIDMDRPLQAIAALREAHTLVPGESRYPLRLAGLLAQEGQFAPALEYFRSYLDLVSRGDGRPLAEDMQLGAVIADRLGNRELAEQYRARQIVLEELEKDERG